MVPPVIAAVAMAAISGALAGATFSAILVNVLMAAVMAGLQMVMAGKSKGSSPRRERKFMVRSGQAPRQVVYGETQIADGALQHWEVTEDKLYLHLILAYAGHEIDGFGEIRFGDEAIGERNADGDVISGRFSGYARVREHLGAPGQTADTLAVAELSEWSGTDRGQTIAYLYVRLKGTRTIFPNGIPQIPAVLRGKKVYDYVTGKTLWSNNAALVCYDYLRDQTYGFAADDADIDPELAAIDQLVCDEMVPVQGQDFTLTFDADTAIITLDKPGLRTGDKLLLSGEAPEGLEAGLSYYWIRHTPNSGQFASDLPYARAREALGFGVNAGDVTASRTAQPRYVADGSHLSDEGPLDVMEDMLSAMAGTPMLTAAGHRLRAGADQPAAGVLNENFLRGDYRITPRPPRRVLYNTVGGTFTDADALYVDGPFPEVTNDVYKNQDGGRRKLHEVEFPYVDEGQRAQRLAIINLAQARQAIRVDFPGNFSAWKYERGDKVLVSLARAGWVDKAFWVVRDGFSGSGLGYDLTLLEAADGLFDLDLDSMVAIDPAPDSQLLIPGDVTAPPGLDYAVVNVRTASGDLAYFIDIKGAPSPDAQVTQYIGEYKPKSQQDWALALASTAPSFPVRIGPIDPTVEYDIRLAAMTWHGAQSEFVTSDDFAPPTDTVAPAPPTGLAAGGEVVAVTGVAAVYEGEAINFTGGGGAGGTGIGHYENVNDSEDAA